MFESPSSKMLEEAALAWLAVGSKDPTNMDWTTEYRLRVAEVLARLSLAAALREESAS